MRPSVIAILLASLATFTGCHRSGFPDTPTGYREFAYVTNSASNTVTVLDLVYLRQDRTLQVGANPTAIAANPSRNEVYVVNTQPTSPSGSLSIIDVAANRVAATIPLHRQPTAIAIDPTGARAYVANSASNTISILDLDARREIGLAGTGEQPAALRISPDGRTLVVSNRASGSISLFDITPTSLRLRAAFPNCPGASDIAILPESSKAFVACSTRHQVMAISLAAAPDSWAAKQNPSLTSDHLLTLLSVGDNPVHLALKPDGGEIFVSNFASNTISEIATGTNEVGTTFTIGNKPTQGIISADNSTLWVANSGADAVNLYSIDDGRLVGSIHTGSSAQALAFSADQHLLLAAGTNSGDVAIIRTQVSTGPALFTLLPAGRSPSAIAVKAISQKP